MTMHPHDPNFGASLGVVPFDRSYVVVPGRLIGGFYPASAEPAETTEKLKSLLACRVDHVINLTEAVEANYVGLPLLDYVPELHALAEHARRSIECRRFPIRDLGVPSVAQMQAILDDVDQAIAHRRLVYLHCWGGRGRTATVVGCYLARHALATGEHALNMIRYLRRTDPKGHTPAPETEEQRDFVRRWKVGE
ncbi:MAG TPA: dual specificity protein phosphatase family protein [Pirellulales bacterium]